MHYSKRPSPNDVLALGSGDFEAVSPAIPRPPRAPLFHHSMVPQQGHGFGGGAVYPAHYSRPPAAPGSLSPVEMNTISSAVATGPQRAQPTVTIRTRPTVKTGFSILLAGALIGAMFGVAVRARQNAADAAFAAQQRSEQEQQQAAVAPPPPAATQAVPVVISPVSAPVAVPRATAALPPAQAYAGVPFGSLVVTPPPQQAPAAAAPAAAAPAAKAPAPAAKAPAKHASWGKRPGGHATVAAKVSPPKDKDDGYKVASAGNDEPKASKQAAKEPKETKKAEAKPAKAARGSSDEADRVLKAAMGATENTL